MLMMMMMHSSKCFFGCSSSSRQRATLLALFCIQVQQQQQHLQLQNPSPLTNLHKTSSAQRAWSCWWSFSCWRSGSSWSSSSLWSLRMYAKKSRELEEDDDDDNDDVVPSSSRFFFFFFLWVVWFCRWSAVELVHQKRRFLLPSACLPHPQSQKILFWGEGRKEGRKTNHPISRRHKIQRTSKFLLHPLGLSTFLCFLPVLFPRNIVWIFPIVMAATAAAIEWFCWNVAMKLL